MKVAEKPYATRHLGVFKLCTIYGAIEDRSPALPRSRFRAGWRFRFQSIEGPRTTLEWIRIDPRWKIASFSVLYTTSKMTLWVYADGFGRLYDCGSSIRRGIQKLIVRQLNYTRWQIFVKAQSFATRLYISDVYRGVNMSNIWRQSGGVYCRTREVWFGPKFWR